MQGVNLAPSPEKACGAVIRSGPNKGRHCPRLGWRDGRCPYHPRVCSVKGCGRPQEGQSRLCPGHRSRWYRYGDVMADRPLRTRRDATAGDMTRGGVPRDGTPLALGCLIP